MVVIINTKTNQCEVCKDDKTAKKSLGITRYKFDKAKTEGFGTFGDFVMYIPHKIEKKSNRGGFREKTY